MKAYPFYIFFLEIHNILIEFIFLLNEMIGLCLCDYHNRTQIHFFDPNFVISMEWFVKFCRIVQTVIEVIRIC